MISLNIRNFNYRAEHIKHSYRDLYIGDAEGTEYLS